jgi:pyridoxal phosphate enzyme (YggS family)
MAATATPEAERLAIVRARIEKARRRFGALPHEVELVAVSKTFPTDAIRPFLDAGQRVFGENRVQEAKEKWPALRQDFPDAQLHLIGPLQTNKVREAVALFDVIETVDREKLAAALRTEMDRAGKELRCFVQVNIGEEPQKSGISPSEVSQFVATCKALHRLDVAGLMCIPPEGLPAGPYFAQLAALARLARVDGLSMGMSADFETAIAMGATHVRVGSVLFGQRPSSQT